MGGASSLGLGLALARPDRRVIVFDGDGSLLMQLGSLATIAGAAPRNLVHFLFKNGVYHTSGAQGIPGGLVGRLRDDGQGRRLPHGVRRSTTSRTSSAGFPSSSGPRGRSSSSSTRDSPSRLR